MILAELRKQRDRVLDAWLAMELEAELRAWLREEKGREGPGK